MQRHNIGYLAGLIDGEGCISAYYDKNNASPRIRVSVVNTDKKMIDWIKKYYGGYTHHRRFRQDNWKDCYAWIINPSRKDKSLIESLIPLLITKKRQMKLVLEYIVSLNNHGEKTSKKVKRRRVEIYQRLKVLNSGSDND